MSIEMSKTEMQRKNRMKRYNRIFNNCGTITKESHMHDGNTRRRKEEEEIRRNIWSNDDWEFSKINNRQQTTNPGSSENTKQDKFLKIYT